MTIKKIIDNMIYETKFLEASDIHFHPLENKVKIYYRIVGKLIYQKDINKEEYNKILRYLKFKTKLDISITKIPQDGAFSIKIKQEEIFIRISTLPTFNSESLVIRILQDQRAINMKNVSFYEEDINNMLDVILNKTGLFIFTGPTGSGKTTTIYSIMTEIAKNYSKKIITIENPVEIINTNLLQVGIDEKLGIDYVTTLKATLRQDPDIIMVGEIRDIDTARVVFRAALTGHTVVSTMHTKDIYGVIERFLDFGFLKSEIQSVLIGISNQRLILNSKGEVRSIYNYAIGDELNKILKESKGGDTIESIIQKAQEQNEQEQKSKLGQKYDNKSKEAPILPSKGKGKIKEDKYQTTYNGGGKQTSKQKEKNRESKVIKEARNNQGYKKHKSIKWNKI